ncbi:hypothetical protein TrLO_g2132 [Triparma laevis f. longispina]|uniref:Uncharacterized protein n=1 Tax=Triparma laevis f. longispina TaxID=1714387 RepID=A0A9W7FRE2_9STRA|nr:hypothetical protein TrLO_g2132 [Triparma laevis f. longispina]
MHSLIRSNARSLARLCRPHNPLNTPIKTQILHNSTSIRDVFRRTVTTAASLDATIGTISSSNDGQDDEPDPLQHNKLINKQIIQSTSTVSRGKNGATKSGGRGAPSHVNLINFSTAQSHHFNGVNWSTMFTTLVSLPKRDHGKIADNADLHALIEQFEHLVAENGMDWIGPREAANITRAMGKLNLVFPNLIKEVSKMSFAHKLMEEDGPRGLTQILHGLATVNAPPPSFAEVMNSDLFVKNYADVPLVTAIARTICALSSYGFHCDYYVKMLGRDAVVDKFRRSRDNKKVKEMLESIARMQRKYTRNRFPRYEVPTPFLNMLDEPDRVEETAVRNPPTVLPMQFNAMVGVRHKAHNHAKEILENADIYCHLHSNLLRKLAASFAESRYQCEPLFEAINDRAKNPKFVKSSSVGFISAFLHLTSRFGYFDAENIYSSILSRSSCDRIVNFTGNAPDTRFFTKTLWAAAYAGKVKANEVAIRRLWNTIMSMDDAMLTRGNLRELHHVKILSAVERVELSWSGEEGGGGGWGGVGGKAGLSKAFNKQMVEQFEQRGWVGAQGKAAGNLRGILEKGGMGGFKEKHYFVEEMEWRDGSSLTLFDFAFEDLKIGIDLPTKSNFLFDVTGEKDVLYEVDGRVKCKERFAKDFGWTTVVISAAGRRKREASLYFMRCGEGDD